MVHQTITEQMEMLVAQVMSQLLEQVLLLQTVDQQDWQIMVRVLLVEMELEMLLVQLQVLDQHQVEVLGVDNQVVQTHQAVLEEMLQIFQ
jgi:exonuclease I